MIGKAIHENIKHIEHMPFTSFSGKLTSTASVHKALTTAVKVLLILHRLFLEGAKSLIMLANQHLKAGLLFLSGLERMRHRNSEAKQRLRITRILSLFLGEGLQDQL